MIASPTLYFLHALGSSSRAFDGVIPHLDGRIRVVGIDLPGFGTGPERADLSVTGMVDHVLSRIARDAAPRWMLVGHSMGGKVASAVASRVLSGTEPVFGLMAVVLLAGSPPTPEPMAEDRRAQMREWAADGPLSDEDARTFIEMNVGAPLDAEDHDSALADLRRTSPQAWQHWLEHGSREDVSPLVGTLDLPAVVLGGDQDDDLGAEAQPGLHADVYPRARFVTLPGAGHLLPFERPAAVADAILRLWDDIAGAAPAVPAEWSRLIASSRTDASVRGALARRAVADDPGYEPRVLDTARLETLRALAEVVVPQAEGPQIDLAARVDAQLHRGEGDGWRHADLPPDPEAYRRGLDALAAAMRGTAEERDAAVRGILDDSFVPESESTSESATTAASGFDAHQLSVWFEDVRVDLVRHWLAHPATMARVGFDGFATGGTVVPLRGFGDLARGVRDAWEPVDLGEERSA